MLGQKRNDSLFGPGSRTIEAPQSVLEKQEAALEGSPLDEAVQPPFETQAPATAFTDADDLPRRTIATEAAAGQRVHSLFFTPESESKDFSSVLQDVQEYISGKYSTLITDGVGADTKEQIKRYISKYVQDRRIAVRDLSGEQLVDALYTEMAEFGFLTKYIFGSGIEEININSWRDIEVLYSSGQMVKLEEHFDSPDHAINVIRRMLHVSGMVIEQNLSQLIHREKYLEYIAKRPRAQRFGTHGLFTGDRDSLVLSQVAEAVAEHPGNVWLPIISLRREDASRLGYDSAENWRSFLSSYAIQMAEAMKIPWEQFRWYAAFHNESHHPHIHMVCYSADPSKGFLTKTGIAQIKSGLAKHIFRQELTALYAQQTRSRDALVQNTCEVMAQLITQMQTGVLENSRIEHLVTVLAQRLRFLSGKKQYGYLKAPLKSLVDEIVDELARDIRVAKAYALWYEQREEVLRTYQEDLPARLPLSQQKEFKKIKNIVIQEALRLGELSQVFLPDEDTVAPEDLPELLCERNGQATEAPPAAAWSKRYKEARQFLYGSDGHPQDQGKALALFRTEALAGNDLAMYALAKLLLDRGEVSQDLSEALRWLRRSAELNNQFAQYRLGKLLFQGELLPQNVEEALQWLMASAQQGNQFAQYALGKLYLLGKEVPQDRDAAGRWLSLAAAQGNEYAQYFLDHMDDRSAAPLLLSATRLLHHLGNIFREQEPPPRSGGMRIAVDRKLLQKIREKKTARGHKWDDHEPSMSL